MIGKKYAMAYVTVVEQLGVHQLSIPFRRGYKRCLQETHGEAPNFQIQSRAKELPNGEGLGLGVSTISLNPVDDEFYLSLVEEIP